MIIPEKTYHLSIDDVFDSLIDVSDRGISLFENQFFRFCKSLHDEFGTNIDLYLFYQKKVSNNIRTLKEVSSSLKDALMKNKWLRFGPHALDPETPPYSQTPDEQVKAFNEIYKEIDRFSGNLSNFVRLHYFSESYELASYFREKGVLALLSTDKDAVSWRIPDETKQELSTKGHVAYEGIEFIISNFRLENFANEKATASNIASKIETNLNTYNFVTLFTHEYEVPRPEVRQATSAALKYLKDKKVSSI